MKLLRLTSDSPAKNLALDEALLETAESTENYPEVLRLWEPPSTMVVLGRSSPLSSEVNLAYCQEHSIPIYRRCSGGQTVVTGTGCLMYSVLLDYRRRPELRMLEKAHQFVMSRMQKALAIGGIETVISGTSDLTLGGRKFSGNALRCKRNWLIYHGTMICSLELSLIARCLGKPIREPVYRQGRNHLEFLTQLPLSPDRIADLFAATWEAEDPMPDWPRALTNELAVSKYETGAWTSKVP